MLSTSIKELKENSITLPLIKACTPLIWVQTQEETMMFADERRALLSSRIINSVYIHDSLNTLDEYPSGRKASGQNLNAARAINWFVRNKNESTESGQQPRVATNGVQTPPADLMEDYAPDGSVLFLFDASAGLQVGGGPGGKHSNPPFTRLLKKSWRDLVRSRKSIIVVSHTADIPPELEHSMVLAEHKLPSVQQLCNLVQSSCGLWKSHADDEDGALKIEPAEMRRIAGMLSGLTLAEGDNVLARAANVNMEKRRIDDAVEKGFDSETIRADRIRNIGKNPTLEIVTPKGGLDIIGGLPELKAYFRQRRKVFEPDWRNEGLSAPKGVLLGGISGTGKTLLSACIGQEWGATVLRGDVSACKGGLVGQSENNFRKMLKDAEAVANEYNPVVLQLDEAGKMFGSGMNGTSGHDSGVSGGLSAIYLTWRQNCTKPVYVIMTCNEDMQNFPMAWLRSGRLDKIFFVDLPGFYARKEIFTIHLNLRNWKEKDIDLEKLAELTEGFSPAEIEQVVEEAILIKMDEEGPRPKLVKTSHLVSGLEKITPMSFSNSDDIEAFRNWANKRGYPGVRGDYRSQTNKKKVEVKAKESDDLGARRLAASAAEAL
jgi:hypothetical protein